jgi:hypothetical protein
MLRLFCSALGGCCSAALAHFCSMATVDAICSCLVGKLEDEDAGGLSDMMSLFAAEGVEEVEAGGSGGGSGGE